MRRILALVLTVGLLSPVYATPLDEFLNLIAPLCTADVPPAILEPIGGSSTQAMLCSVHDVVGRANGILAGATGNLDGFLRSAFDDGFSLLRDYADLGTDLGVLEEIAQVLRGQVADGLSFEDAFAALAHSVAADKLRALLTPSTEDPDSLAFVVEENRRLNPRVLATELAELERAVELQSRSAAATDTAAQASQLALDAINRGDEANLTLNVTNPDPLNPGIADEAAIRAQNAVSTRAAVQAMLEFQADAARQQALETTSLLTSIKELGVQQAYTVQELSFVARELYAQRLDEQNSWRARHLAALERRYRDAQNVGASFRSLSDVLETTAGQFGDR